jgi:gliding motility-associated-like protein
VEYKDDIEQLFKNTFDNYESDVNPDAWMNIQNGLNLQSAAHAGSSANNVSSGAKLTASSSKLSLMSVIGTTAAIIGITATVIYFSSNNEIAENKQADEIKTDQSTSPVAVSANTENKSLSEAENSVKEKSPVSTNASVEINNNSNDKKLTSNESAAYYSSTNEDVSISSMDRKNVAEVTDTKNSNSEATLQNSPVPAAAPPVPDKKSNESGIIEEESSDQNEEDAVNSASQETKKEENNIEQFLGRIPNVITPNGDGDNDVLIIEGKNLSKLEVSIVDQRTGKIVHSWNNLHGFWDGRLNNGEPAKEGIYFYNIFARTNTGHPLTKHGPIQLLLKNN